MNIVHVGCSFSRGYYGDNKVDPNPHPSRNLCDILAKKLPEHLIYNFSLYISSIETQCFVINHLLKKQQKIDLLIWQVTTAYRLGFINNRNRFLDHIDYSHCTPNDEIDNIFTLKQNMCGKNFDPWYSSYFVNIGRASQTGGSNWFDKTYLNLMKYAVNSVGRHWSIESSLANIMYTKNLLEKRNIPHIIFPWLNDYKKADTFDLFDFVVEKEIDFNSQWHDNGHHFGPMGLHKVADLILPLVQKI